MLSYRLHPEAEEEALAAQEYIYNDDPQEAEKYTLAFKEALKWVQSQPLLFRCFEKDYRKAKVGKFRYSLIFRIRDIEIQILAVAHHSLKPGYWKNREM
jgi:plasmid stabilization system protein ParE